VEKEKEGGHILIPKEFLPRVEYVCECTNPIIENNTDRLKDHSSLYLYRSCEKICININREYSRAILTYVARLVERIEGTERG